MESSTVSHTLRCVIVTPEKALLDEVCDFVALPMYDGELGVLPGRLPLIGRLGYGELRIRKSGVVSHYYVDGGFVQIRSNVVTVLTAKAIKGSDITESQVTTTLAAAKKAGGPDALLKAQARVRAQKRVAQHASPEKVLTLEGQ